MPHDFGYLTTIHLAGIAMPTHDMLSNLYYRWIEGERKNHPFISFDCNWNSECIWNVIWIDKHPKQTIKRAINISSVAYFFSVTPILHGAGWKIWYGDHVHFWQRIFHFECLFKESQHLRADKLCIFHLLNISFALNLRIHCCVCVFVCVSLWLWFWLFMSACQLTLFIYGHLPVKLRHV